MIARGTTSWSLCAILNPKLIGCPIDAYRTWPDVVWRMVDRGDTASLPADIGAMELFASSVVATDPYRVADLIGTATR
jgi:hypothetical protein